MNRFLTAVLFAAALVTTLWGDSPNTNVRQQAEAELRQIHNLELEAHRKTDVKALLANGQDGFINVRDGSISRSNLEDARQRFQAYFKNATYQEYADLEEPVIRASEDGTMGWVISQTRARRSQLRNDGRTESDAFVYAGIMTYEKRNGKWFRVANVSTFERHPPK